jgi:hypothetical protein
MAWEFLAKSLLVLHHLLAAALSKKNFVKDTRFSTPTPTSIYWGSFSFTKNTGENLTPWCQRW